jgi:hypothetical protein
MASTITFGAAVEDRPDEGTPPMMTLSQSVRAAIPARIVVLDRQTI